MSQQRSIKKQLMKHYKIGTKKVEHFFKNKRKTGTRITSMIGVHKFVRTPGKMAILR